MKLSVEIKVAKGAVRIQMHCDCLFLCFVEKCLNTFIAKYMFGTNLYSCFLLGIYFRVVKVYWHFRQAVSHQTNEP
jgi:hypothetical protein